MLVASEPNAVPHFRQTVRHRRWRYLAVCLLTLAAVTAAAYVINSQHSTPHDRVLNAWRWLAIVYVAVFGSSTFIMRRRGAPLLVMTVALAYYSALMFWYTWCWWHSPTPEKVLPGMGVILFLALIPLVLALPFFRRIKHVKGDFREKAIATRKSIKARERSANSVIASRNLYELIKLNVKPRDGFIAVYAAVASELSLESLVLNLARAGYKVAFPAIIGEGVMRFYTTIGSGELNLESINLIVDPMGVRTPDDLKRLQLVEPRRISVIVVPGVAFDVDRYRMGFGGGFYDRYLPRLRETTKVIGIGFDQQIYKSLPVEPHDQRLDAVVTPTACYYDSATLITKPAAELAAGTTDDKIEHTAGGGR